MNLNGVIDVIRQEEEVDGKMPLRIRIYAMIFPERYTRIIIRSTKMGIIENLVEGWGDNKE